MSIHECAGCGEMRDVTNGKCVDCWRVDAVYLRTNITAIAELLRLDINRTSRERETEKVLRGALEPLDRAAYRRARDILVDAEGCAVTP